MDLLDSNFTVTIIEILFTFITVASGWLCFVMCYYVYHYVCIVSLCVFACISTCTLGILIDKVTVYPVIFNTAL